MTDMSESKEAQPIETRGWLTDLRRRVAGSSNAGQTALVAVLTITVILSIIGVTLTNTVIKFLSGPTSTVGPVVCQPRLGGRRERVRHGDKRQLQPGAMQHQHQHRGTCSGINYGQWNLVENSTESGGDAEYYAFGNPVPNFDPTTHTLISLAVQMVGAAHDSSAPNGYLFDQETITVAPNNGFLQNVWWSNYESYSPTGSYATCNYNWMLNYDINNDNNVDCSAQVYFGPDDYLFGPVFTNDSVFVSGNGSRPIRHHSGHPLPDGDHGRSVPGNHCRSPLPVCRQYLRHGRRRRQL